MTGSGPDRPGESITWEEEAERLASRALAAGDATGWFEQLYAAGAGGRVPVPWGRRDPHPLFVDWAQRRAVRGEGGRAVVVGCGLGADAEYTGRLGFDTTGFDISATAIRLAGQRFPHTTVHYQVADLLALPAAWRHAFDLVVEIITVQALPDPVRRQAIENIAGLVAADGTLLVLAAAHDPDVPESPVPPWPLRQNEIDAFATGGLMPVRVELFDNHGVAADVFTPRATRTDSLPVPPRKPPLPTTNRPRRRARAPLERPTQQHRHREPLPRIQLIRGTSSGNGTSYGTTRRRAANGCWQTLLTRLA
jgi:SAM-dependent methyltransferase